MSVLVTRAAEETSCAHSPDVRRARCAPEPPARDRGSSPGSRLWPASAADSPLCSRDDTPSPSSSAGGAGCGGRAGIIARSADTYVVFEWSSVGSLRPPMMSPRARSASRHAHDEKEDQDTKKMDFNKGLKKTPSKKMTSSLRPFTRIFGTALARTLPAWSQTGRQTGQQDPGAHRRGAPQALAPRYLGSRQVARAGL